MICRKIDSSPLRSVQPCGAISTGVHDAPPCALQPITCRTAAQLLDGKALDCKTAPCPSENHGLAGESLVRFSLKTLFLAVTACCMIAASWSWFPAKPVAFAWGCVALVLVLLSSALKSESPLLRFYLNITIAMYFLSCVVAACSS